MKNIIVKYVTALLAALLIWNLIIGNLVYRIPNVQQTSVTGKRYAPDSVILIGNEGFGKNRTDHLGYNNANRLGTQFDGEILVLGDSHTEALQVDRILNFCSLLEKKLQETNPGLRVYNAGMSGNSTSDYIYYSNEYLKTFLPDKVIIQVTYDDFTKDALDTGKNIFISSNDGQFSIIRNLSQTQRLKKIKDFVVGLSPITAFSYAQLQKYIGNLPIGSAVAKDNNKNSIQAGLPALVKWQVDELKRAYGDRLLILYLPYVPRIENGNVSLIDETEMQVKALICESCSRDGIPFIDATDGFINLYKQHNKLPRGFSNTEPGTGHLNPDGHAVVAGILYEALKNNLK